MFKPSANHPMRIFLSSTSSVQFRFRWTSSCSYSTPKIQWNLGSVTPRCFMSTLPLDTDGDHIEFGPSSRKLANNTAPNGIQSSKTRSDVPEDGITLWQSISTETHVQTANAGGSGVGMPQSPPWEQTRTTTTTETTSSTSLTTTEESIAAAKSRAIAALRQGQPHELLSSILQAAKDPAFIESLPDTAILQLERLLDPKSFIEPYKQLYTDLPPSLYLNLARFTDGLDRVLLEFTSVYDYIVHKVIAQRQTLGFQKYEILLKIAAVTGDAKLATETWNNMHKREFEPDVECYNHYFEALCWPKTRIVGSPRLLWSISNETFHVKSTVSRMFTSMIAQGVMADANTFGLLIIAYSRGGDLEGVKVILKKVWGIDVDAIMHTDDNSRSVDDLPPDSPLHPTSDLLFTIAHAFGLNKNLAVGLRLIDHISCRFSVPIEDRTWNELLKWTFIFSRRSSLRKKRYGEYVPLWGVQALWQTMISTHKPGMHVLERVFKIFYHRRMVHLALRVMILGLLLRKESRATYFRSVKERNKPSDNNLVQFSLSALQYKTHLNSIEDRRDFYWISRFVGYILRKPRWFSNSELQILGWERRSIPEFVHLFWPFRSQISALHYPMKSGRVKLRNSTSLPMQYRDFDLNEYLEMEIDDLVTHRQPPTDSDKTASDYTS